MAREKKETKREAGRKGGETTKAKHGSDFYATIGKKGGQNKSTNKNK